MARSLLLDEDEDIALVSGQTFVVDGRGSLIQRLTSRLKISWGEWWLNTRLGVDYHGTVLAEEPSYVKANAFRRALVDDPEVRDAKVVVLDEGTSDGAMNIEFTVTTTSGDSVPGTATGALA